MSEFILGKKLTEQEEWLAHIVRQQERERILELLTSKLCDCRFGYPETLKKYYKTSGNRTRESLEDEHMNWGQRHMYCNDWQWVIKFIEREGK